MPGAPFPSRLSDAGASVADLGTFVPIIAALVVVNGVDAAAALVVAGGLSFVAAAVYRVPTPVQPIKAAAAIAIATGARAEVIAATGLVLGAVLLALAMLRAHRLLARMFPTPVIRGNQLGVGLLLVVAATRLAREAPSADGFALAATAALVVALVVAERSQRVPAALVLVAAGIGWSLVSGPAPALGPALSLPHIAVPSRDAIVTAMTALAIPQLPLTLGNAIVGTADLERRYFGARARRVNERRLLATSGAANLAAGFLGGVPLCHGSSGATAYHRFGGRTGVVNVALGVLLVASGLSFGSDVVALFALIPSTVLAALLAYTGIRHALLVADLRAGPLAVALSIGLVGAATQNLMLGMLVGVPAYVVLALARRTRTRGAQAGAAR